MIMVPETVTASLAYLAPYCKVSAIQRLLRDSTPLPVRLTMQGIRRTHAPTQSVRKVQPAVTSVIYKLVDSLGPLIDLRDRTLLLIGFAGAFRRSELEQLRVSDFTKTEDGLRMRLR